MFQAEEVVSTKVLRQEHPWRESKEASVAEAEWRRERIVGDEDQGGYRGRSIQAIVSRFAVILNEMEDWVWEWHDLHDLTF